MRTTFVYLAFLIAILGSATTLAQQNCGFFPQVVVVSPGHPGPSDTIYYTVQIVPSPIIDVHTRFFSLASALPDSPTQLTVDLVIGDDSMNMPGYQVAGGLDAYMGYLAPLPPANYQIAPTVRVLDPSTGQLVPYCPGHNSESSFTVYQAPSPTVTAPVIEYYYAALDHYFLTQDVREIQALDGGAFPGWTRTGQSFLAYAPGQSDDRGLAVSRYYGPPSAGLDSHFYTSLALEIAALQMTAWQLESNDVFELPSPPSLTGECPQGTIPVYRLWDHRPDNDHRFTTDLAIRQAMIASGYVSEGFGPSGVAMCSLAP